MSSWQNHLQAYRKAHPSLSMKDAMKGASATFKKQKGGRKLTESEKKNFPKFIGPFPVDVDGDNWENRTLLGDITGTVDGMKKTWKDDPTGLNKVFKKIPVIGETADKLLGSGNSKPKKTLMVF